MKQVKRILAIIGIIFLVGLYLITLLCAIFDNSNSMVMFQASILCTVLVPALIWAYTFIYRLAKGKDGQESEETLQSINKNEKPPQKHKPQ